jgi:nucleoside permease NupC
MEAISHGSISAINVVAAVLANLISFVALMALISGVLGYAGQLLGYSDWSLEMFFGYLFAPMAYLIGVTDNFEQTLVKKMEMERKLKEKLMSKFRLSVDCLESKLLLAILLLTKDWAMCFIYSP